MRIIISLLVLIFSFSACMAASANPGTPTAEASPFANHTITHAYYLNDKVYCVLDDSSLWEINPEQKNDPEEYAYLANNYVTIMPDNGLPDYHCTFIIGDKIESFTVTPVAAPLQSAQLLEIDPSGSLLAFGNIDKSQIQYVDIIPTDYERVMQWQNGQKVIVGGVWFPEFDPQGRSDCGFLFTLYNFDTNEFVRFNTHQ